MSQNKSVHPRDTDIWKVSAFQGGVIQMGPTSSAAKTWLTDQAYGLAQACHFKRHIVHSPQRAAGNSQVQQVIR